jgi:hypothetical protein
MPRPKRLRFIRRSSARSAVAAFLMSSMLASGFSNCRGSPSLSPKYR